MTLLQQLQQGDIKALARVISLIENEAGDYYELLSQLPSSNTKILGITGPPGAGKSTLIDGLIEEIAAQNKKAGILCIDPSSSFHRGALLGDRIRMSKWYNHPGVYIRSISTRGSLGGLHPKVIEITDVMKAAAFDQIIVETVGVGQSEVEIASLADTTVVVLVPESGDEVQTMKAGLMEIADIFVVNKSDRPGADAFIKNLLSLLAPAFHRTQSIPILKTVSTQKKGISELYRHIIAHQENASSKKKLSLLGDKAYYLIQQYRMQGIKREDLIKEIEKEKAENFNLYTFIEKYKR